MSTKYENSNMTADEMSKLIEAAKAQQLEKNKKVVEKKNTVQIVNNIQTTTDINSMEHGAYVRTEDGIGGIVVDHEVEIQKMREKDETGNKLMQLIKSDGLVTDANQYVADYGEDAPKDYDPGVEYIKQNPYEPKVQKMKEIKEAYSNFTFGLKGLVDKNSEEGRRVSEALEKLRSGEVVLPTPEEYEQQKKEAEERRKRKQQQNEVTKPVEDTPKEKEVIDTTFDDDEPQMAEMPENIIIKKGVDDILNNMNTPQEVQSNEVKTPVAPVDINQPTKAPIDLAGIESDLEEEAIEEKENQVNNTPEIKPDEIVEINVPSGQAKEVMENLPLNTYEKVVNAKVVKINEVELKDLPTAATRVTDIAAYKRLARRRPSTKTAEATERVLINSGIVVTVKAATSLEMATIFKSPTSSDIDWEKEYTFCYEHTIGTSIGRISYNEFCSRVSPSDIETILDGIYEISETDTRKISIICGANDGGCGEDYEVEAVVAKLPNIDSLTDEAKARIKEIIDHKNSIDESKEIVAKSPTSIVKHIKIDDERIIDVRSTTGHMMIERMDRINSIGQTYGTMVALLMLYVEKITLTIKEREDAKPQSFLLDTVDLIAEELLTLKDPELEYIKAIITDDIKDYPTMTYSIKGPCRCPHCGNTRESIPCNISDLVFQKAQNVLA